MPRKLGVVLIIVGTALILSALSLLVYNRYTDARAGAAAESMLSAVRSVTGQEREAESMFKEGYSYEGCLAIPALNLELPVMAEWDYAKLKLAPCRHFGSAATEDLVIAGHNYKSHFGSLSRLKPGDTVLFTDMAGTEYTYAVIRLETLAPTAVETVRDSGCPLTLYTCTYGGKTRTAVFCDWQEKAAPERERGRAP